MAVTRLEKDLSEFEQAKIAEFITEQGDFFRSWEFVDKIAHWACYPAIRAALMQLPLDPVGMVSMVNNFPVGSPAFNFSEASRFAQVLELEKFFGPKHVKRFIAVATAEESYFGTALGKAFSELIDFNGAPENSYNFWKTIDYMDVFGISEAFARSAFFKRTHWTHEWIINWLDNDKYPEELIIQLILHPECGWGAVHDYLNRTPLCGWRVFLAIASRKAFVDVRNVVQFARGYLNEIEKKRPSDNEINETFLLFIERMLERDLEVHEKIYLLAEANFQKELFLKVVMTS